MPSHVATIITFIRDLRTPGSLLGHAPAVSKMARGRNSVRPWEKSEELQARFLNDATRALGRDLSRSRPT